MLVIEHTAHLILGGEQDIEGVGGVLHRFSSPGLASALDHRAHLFGEGPEATIERSGCGVDARELFVAGVRVLNQRSAGLFSPESERRPRGLHLVLFEDGPGIGRGFDGCGLAREGLGRGALDGGGVGFGRSLASVRRTGSYTLRPVGSDAATAEERGEVPTHSRAARTALPCIRLSRARSSPGGHGPDEHTEEERDGGEEDGAHRDTVGLRHTPRKRPFGSRSPVPPTTMPPVTFRLLAFAAFCAVFLPSTAFAVDGFDKLTWGMSPDQVRAAYPQQLIQHDPKPKSPPEGTVPGRLVFDGAIFEAKVEVSAFFDNSGLAVVRLQYRAPSERDVTALTGFYAQYWGQPLETPERDGGRLKKSWSWPWEGVELRQVEEDGKVVYGRLDYSALLKEEWRRTDAVICSILPSSSGCAFADRQCPATDAAIGTGKRSTPFDLAGSRGEVSCNYTNGAMSELRLVFEEPGEKAADWVGALLSRRLGAGTEDRSESAENVRVDLTWPNHGAELSVHRKARVKTAKGWTGPVDRIRFKRVFGATATLAPAAQPGAQPQPGQPSQPAQPAQPAPAAEPVNMTPTAPSGSTGGGQKSGGGATGGSSGASSGGASGGAGGSGGSSGGTSGGTSGGSGGSGGGSGGGSAGQRSSN